jgi:hypothetical protein
MGGLSRLEGDHLRLILGRLRLDPALGWPEPIQSARTISVDSLDGGLSWSEPSNELQLFPGLTEFYGASNPHPLSEDRLLWAITGTQRGNRGWQAGVTISQKVSCDYSSPIIIAAAPDRDFADIDLIRLEDGRFLAVIREMVTGQSVAAWSSDEGCSWSSLRPTGFRGANIKLAQLRSGEILCIYRDEDPVQLGVSCSVSADGGTSWHFVGQLYEGGSAAARNSGGSQCGYPDLVSLDDSNFVGVLSTFPDASGIVDLHLLHLIDHS